MGVQLVVEHEFSAECSSEKRSFLRAMLPVSRLFVDVRDLAAAEASAETSTGAIQKEAVPEDTDILMAGFPCTSASGLNKYAGTDENRTCVESGTLSTGEIFRAILDYVASRGRHLRVLIFENVLALARKGPKGDSNLDAVFQALAALGWWAFCFHLDPRDFGTAASRPRLWIVCFRMSAVEASTSLTYESLATLLETCMNTLVGSQLAPMEAYLLPTYHSSIRSAHLANGYQYLASKGHMEAALALTGGIHYRSGRSTSSQSKTRLGISNT
jgi:site-specific DNA-cytosine methylase